jgi:hypothetical protein
MAVVAHPNPSSFGDGGVTSFPHGGKLITPSDADTFSVPTAIRADTAGTVVVTPWNSAADITLTLAVGEYAGCMCRAVKSTGTTGGIVLHGFF